MYWGSKESGPSGTGFQCKNKKQGGRPSSTLLFFVFDEFLAVFIRVYYAAV